MNFTVARGNSGYLLHAVIDGVALCGYRPEGATSMGRSRARWEYHYNAGAASVTCPGCKKKLAARPALLKAEAPAEGWGNLDNARDAHYFRAGRSLCKRWGAFGSPRWERNQELGSEPTRGTCKACWTKRAAEEGDAVLAIGRES